MTPDRPRAVADTNVVVSAILAPGSRPFFALQHVTARRDVIGSAATLSELRTVLSRSKFDSRLSFERRMRALERYASSVIPSEPTERIRACRDSRDDKFLELAVSGGADLILTGDADLLALHPFRGIAILTPADYLLSVAVEAPTEPGT